MNSRKAMSLVLALSFSAIASFALSSEAAATPPPNAPACLPRTVADADVNLALHLGQSGGAWLICANARGVGPKACWEVDRRKGTLTPHATELLPGVSYAVPEDGCVAGLCLPKLPAPNEPRDAAEGPREAFLSVHADGRRAVIYVAPQFVVFDRKTQQILASFDLRGPPNGGADTIGNVPQAIWFLGDVIFVEGFDAGPGAYVGSYRADGTPIGLVKPIDDEYVVNTYRGRVSALDATHLGISADGLTQLHVVSGANGRVEKSLARKLPKAPCNVDDFPSWDDETLTSSDTKAACRNYIKRNLVPWTDIAIVADGDRFLGFDSSRAQLIELDGSLVEKRRISLRKCAK